MKPLTLVESLRQPIARWTAQRLLTTGFVLAVATLLVTGGSSYLQIRTLIRDRVSVLHSRQVVHHIDLALTLMSDAEAGQRGYLITGDERYLDPYRESLPLLETNLAELDQLTKDDPRQSATLKELRAPVDDKLAVLAETISRRRIEGAASKVSPPPRKWSSAAAVHATWSPSGVCSTKCRSNRTK